MSNGEMLGTLGGTRGVRNAALYDATGAQVAHYSPSMELSALSAMGELDGLSKSASAIVQGLKQPLNADGWTDLVLDLEGGAALFTPSADGGMLAVSFDEMSSLGRVRLAVRRTLEALAAPLE